MSISVELKEVRRIRGFSVEGLIGGLPRPRALAWVPPLTNSEDAREFIAEEAPVDGEEVVEWMHYAAADMAVMEVFAQSVEDNGGRISFRSGDGYIPGVRESSSFYVISERGSTVRSRGYARVRTPYGVVNVPVGGKKTIVFKDFLAWAALPWTGWIQFTISLLRWLKLPRAPITKKMPFPSSYGKSAPNFIVVSTRVPTPIATMRMVVTSDKDQKMVLRGRSTSDYTRTYFEKELEIESGEAEYTLILSAFPVLPSFVLELQPQDGTRTTLNKLEVFP